MTYATPANLYTAGQGIKSQNVEIPHYSPVNPDTTNVNFPLGKEWINTTTGAVFILTLFSSYQGTTTASWSPVNNAPFLIFSAGTAPPLVAGQVVVNDAACTGSSIVLISPTAFAGTPGVCEANTISTGSFQLFSTSDTDTSVYFYMIMNA